jgi:hypothetical protein
MTILRINAGKLKGKEIPCKSTLEALYYASLIEEQYHISKKDMDII